MRATACGILPPSLMTVFVFTFLKVVDVNAKDRHQGILTIGAGDFLARFVAEKSPVAESGEVVDL